MRYFITGATGFIGGRLARQLLAAGHEVHALVRDPGKAADLAALGAHLAEGDITDADSLRQPMAGTDGVFHVAGWYKVGGRHSGEGQRINVDGTRNVLEAMRDLGIAKGVYISTVAVNSDTRGQMVNEDYHFAGQHLSEYDRTKAAAHQIATDMMAAGLPLVIVSPGMVYGPGDTSSLLGAIRQYMKRQLPMLPQRQAMCWAHVDDVAHAHILAMQKGAPGETYIIAGPPHSIIEFYQMAESITGVPAPRMHVAPTMVKGMSAVAGVLEKVLPMPPMYSAEYLRVLGGTTYLGDNTKAKRELGYAPRSLREGLEGMGNW